MTPEALIFYRQHFEMGRCYFDICCLRDVLIFVICHFDICYFVILRVIFNSGNFQDILDGMYFQVF